MKSFLLIMALSIPAYAADTTHLVEQEKYDLKCEVGAVCFEQSIKNAKHNFHVEPGSLVRVEVLAKNGASLSLVSGGNTMSASYLQVGTQVKEPQVVMLESPIDKTGDFSLDVQVAKITINGKPQNTDNGEYNLKITRIGAVKAKEIPGESI